MPLAPSARICRIRSSSGERESANNIGRSTAPSTALGDGSALLGLSHIYGTGEEEGQGEVLLHGTALPSSLSSNSCPQLGCRAWHETANLRGQVLPLLHSFTGIQRHTVALKPVKKCWCLDRSGPTGTRLSLLLVCWRCGDHSLQTDPHQDFCFPHTEMPIKKI